MDIQPSALTLPTDGIEYDILQRAVIDARPVPGLICEIGTRRGGSMAIMMQAHPVRTFISVDPYGDIPYNDGRAVTRYDYTNQMKAEAMAGLWARVFELKVNFAHFCLTDAVFMSLFADGVPVYNYEPTVENRYAVVFLDGPHDTTSVTAELIFFAARMGKGGQIVIDNIDFFDLDSVLCAAEEAGMKEVERGVQKIRLCKV